VPFSFGLLQISIFAPHADSAYQFNKNFYLYLTHQVFASCCATATEQKIRHPDAPLASSPRTLEERARTPCSSTSHLTLGGTPSGTASSLASASANMKARCEFLDACSKSFYPKGSRRNAALKPIIFIGPGSNSSPSERFAGSS